VNDEIWNVINAQLGELRTATTADEVLRILSLERNPHGPGVTSADGFFAGSGGDRSVLDALTSAGWEPVWVKAHHHWAAKARTGTASRTWRATSTAAIDGSQPLS
jgi:hypothetical protein